MVEYVLHVCILLSIFVILSTSLNLLVGYTGLVSLAHAACYGIGAYCAALLVLDLRTPPALNLVVGVLLAAGLSLFIGWCAIRLTDEYLVLATFSFQVIIHGVLKNWTTVTNGPLGVVGIPSMSVGGLHLDTNWCFFPFSAAVAACVVLVLWTLVRSPYGRVLKAIRGDEAFAASLGKDVRRFKLVAVAFGGGLAAVAGFLYAHYARYVDPSSFSVTESIVILTMVIVGGSGRLRGSVVGAALVLVVPEVLRFIGLPSAVASNVRQVVFGLILVLLMLFRPQGLFGDFGLERSR